MRSSVSSAIRQDTLQTTAMRRTSLSVPSATRLVIHNSDVLEFGITLRKKHPKDAIRIEISTTYSSDASNVERADTSNVQEKIGAKTLI